MLCFSGFELYSRWVPLICFLPKNDINYTVIKPPKKHPSFDVVIEALYIQRHCFHCHRLKPISKRFSLESKL